MKKKENENSPPPDPEDRGAKLLPILSHLVLVRTKGGFLIPTVDGKPLNGVQTVTVHQNHEGCFLNMSFMPQFVHFETESDLDPHQLN